MTRRRTRWARWAATAATVTLVASFAPASSAPAWAGASVQAQLAAVRAATAAYHDVTAAETAGFVPFLPCFDDPQLGGMGQHFLLASALGTVDLTHPPVLVYEPRDHGYRLVAVEYVVPGPPTMTPPVLLGRSFTYLASLGVWKLHAWIWRPNPSGMFADYNPAVNRCPPAG